MAAFQRRETDRVGALKRSYTSRALLPFEVEICETLGLTHEDYFYFCRLAEAKAAERSEEYDLVPDVRNEPTTIAIVQLVIGLALVAVSALIAPKPPTLDQDDPRQLKTADIKGQNRFAQYYSFDALQDLAELGTIIPLVFANRNDTLNIGGIRAKGLLLWSQMSSTATQQELKALFTLGLGIVGAPDLKGWALGDQLLSTYIQNRYSLYWRPNGGRIDETDNRYAGPTMGGQGYEDVFLAPDDQAVGGLSPMFCGTRTPNSQTVFGVSEPISNGVDVRLGYELVLVRTDDDDRKYDKINRSYPSYQGLVSVNNQLVAPGSYAVVEGDVMDYVIEAPSVNTDNYQPWGLDDVKNMTDDRKLLADDLLQVGESYLCGSAMVECIGASTQDPWIDGTNKSYQFRCVRPGTVAVVDPRADSEGGSPNLSYGPQLQRCTFGVVTNNRRCDQTEIGIKSTVWKRLNGWSNVNSEPEPEVVQEYEDSDSDTITLGRVNRYVTRWSFFRVEYSSFVNPNDMPWSELTNGTVFAVKNNSPTELYNFIRFSHPRGEYKFRFQPVCGAEAMSLLGNYVIVLDGVYRNMSPQPLRDGISMVYSGRGEILTENATSNKDFNKYGRNAKSGQVINITPTDIGNLPPNYGWKLVGNFIQFNAVTREFQYAVVEDGRNAAVVKAFFDGVEVELSGEYRKGDPYTRLEPTFTAADWVATSTPSLKTDSGGPNDYYYQVDVNGNFLNAIWAGNPVDAQTQQGNTVDPNAIYRRGTEYKTVPGYAYPVESEVLVYESPTGNYFGVWQVRGEPESTQRAFWDGVEVTEILGQDTLVAPGIWGQYRRGRFGIYLPSINCDVYYIERVTRQPNGFQYFYSIEQGSYQSDEPPLDVYYIDQYEFDEENTPFEVEPAIYPVEGGSGSGMTISASSFEPGQWQWVLVDGGSDYVQGEQVTAQLPNKDGSFTPIQITVTIDPTQPGEIPVEKMNPFDALADYRKYDEEETSHQSGPEHSITYVNEMIRQEAAPQYGDLALVGLRMRAGRDWTSLGQITGYCSTGIRIERLLDLNNQPYAGTDYIAPSNLLPEIAYNLLIDPRIGAGARVPRSSVDRTAMTVAAQFCLANGFYWDGVVGDRSNLRQWIFDNAGYCLLNFTIVGGRFALTPAVPFNQSTGVVDATVPVPISALLTDGNMRNMKVTWLAAAERQMFKGVATFREEVVNGFAINRSIRLRLGDSYGGSDADPEKAFDMTGFCTSRSHAETFLKYALQVQKEVDHSISFETTPGVAAGIAPGAYIKVASESTHTSRFNNGSIDSEGNVTGTSAPQDGTFTITYWSKGTTEVRTAEVTVVDGVVTDPAYHNIVYTVLVSGSEIRTYQVEAITINDDGFVEVTATHQPLNSSGGLKVIDFGGLDKFVSDT